MAGEMVLERHTSLEEIFDALRQADSLDAAWDRLVQSYLALGIRAIAYLLLDSADHTKPVVLREHGYSPAVVDRFAELGYGRTAPLLRIALATAQPLLASEVANERISREEAQHRQAMLDAGMGDSLALPLYAPLGREAIVFLAQPDDTDLFDERFRTVLHMIAQAAHLRFFVMLTDQASNQNDLSRREMEILRWVAQGKSNIDIAAILGIAPNTVDTYLKRLFEKLGVADRTSAAVKGVSMGIIRG